MQNNIILKTIIITNKTRNWVSDVTNRWRAIFINRIGGKRNLRGTCCFQFFSFILWVNNQNHTLLTIKLFTNLLNMFAREIRFGLARNLFLDDFVTSHPALKEFSHDIYTLYYLTINRRFGGMVFIRVKITTDRASTTLLRICDYHISTRLKNTT